MSGKSRWRGYPGADLPHRDGPPRPGIDFDPGREGSPYTFEGSMGRNWNIVGSLTSRDPEFRRKASRRMAWAALVMALPLLIVAIALIVQAV